MMFSALNEAHIYIGKWLVKEKHHIFYNVPSIALKWDTSPSFFGKPKVEGSIYISQ